MPETKTVRVTLGTKALMDKVRSPGETDAQLIDRAMTLLLEIKNITVRFSESQEYRAWLDNRRQEHDKLQ